jgi:hypothetical protein
LLFIRILRLDGRLEYFDSRIRFFENERFITGLCRWFLFLVLHCMQLNLFENVVGYLQQFINENMYLHGRGKISNLINRLLREFPDQFSFVKYIYDEFPPSPPKNVPYVFM